MDIRINGLPLREASRADLEDAYNAVLAEARLRGMDLYWGNSARGYISRDQRDAYIGKYGTGGGSGWAGAQRGAE